MKLVEAYKENLIRVKEIEATMDADENVKHDEILKTTEEKLDGNPEEIHIMLNKISDIVCASIEGSFENVAKH